ncbi:hypothetical protein B0F90DRAFT_1810362 [Multifurca ochricompacta]|uniref:F-box domain-containing protein n=1 Tax=Multifurca ochricompacta TaxID=376703 RepID=A0AAD4QKM8_9AGAM|nr:hypothetical protein B0F90DRAFT_1810362 [Multifurca ochricompacta]
MPLSHHHSIPTDIFYSVLGHLTDRRDLYAAALTNSTFNHAATPLLYRTLDTDTRTRLWDHKSGSDVVHPAYTLLRRPELARHVRHVRETGVLHATYPTVTEAVLKALRLCDNLHSFTWIDDTSASPAAFLSFLVILRRFPYDAWTLINAFPDLKKVAVWCMNGPPRVLQGWAPLLGSTLIELELGRCAGVPATILIAVLSQLPRLRDLRLKGAPSGAIPDILASLPALVALDTESDEYPSCFLLSLARRHAGTLRQFLVNMTQLTLEDVQCVCELFPRLEELSCAVASRDAESIGRAIERARNLRSLKLHVHWIPTTPDAADAEFLNSPNSPIARFGLADAQALMRRPGSRLRMVSMGPHVFQGSWVRKQDADGSERLQFEVAEDNLSGRGC